ncbi:MAG TPA: protein kinase [Tabrizicola sp.]
MTQGPTQISNQLEAELGRVDPDAFADDLKPGTELLGGHYTIVGFLNSGGFGITYLAKDSLDRTVVIKECFPNALCRRSTSLVRARSRKHQGDFRSFVESFVAEAKSLARLVHPNIVGVHQVFEDNDTAYMAIDFIDGLDLQQVIDGEGPPLSAEHIVRVTEKLLHAVGFIHDHDMLHRDISPDNVLIDQSGEPILIDFGAAREHASKTTRAMSALRVVKDGYSPQEFYIAGSEQGPWSDLYALGATLYHLISGEAPVNGQARLAALAEDRPDPYTPLAGRYEGYPPQFLEAIDRAMSTLPKQRLQSAAEWLAFYKAAPGAASASPAVATASLDDVVQKLVDDYKREDGETAAAGQAAPPLAKASSRLPEETMPPAPAARGKSPVQLVAGIAVALVVVAGGYVMLGGMKPPEGAATETAADTGTKVVAASVAPAAETAKPEPEPVIASETKTAAAEPVAATVDPAPTEPAKVETAKVEPAAEVKIETATVAPAAAAETAAAEPAPAAATDVIKPAEKPETASAPAEPVAEPAAVAAAEPTAEPAPAAAEEAPVVAEGPAPVANQVAFAAWDVEMPFAYDDRMVDGTRVAVVTRFAPGVDAQRAGDWLRPGVTIFAVNGMPIQATRSLTVAVMNAMAVDPDGMARVVVEFGDGSPRRKTGLLTVGAVRLMNLQNGIAARSLVVDGVWKTEVTAVTRPDMTTLKPGDVLFRDKLTATPLDQAQSLENILADLVGKGVTRTEFSIIRDDKVSEAAMALVLDGGK